MKITETREQLSNDYTKDPRYEEMDFIDFVIEKYHNDVNNTERIADIELQIEKISPQHKDIVFIKVDKTATFVEIHKLQQQLNSAIAWRHLNIAIIFVRKDVDIIQSTDEQLQRYGLQRISGQTKPEPQF